jgi:ABC-type branched-subunit amino acid transport system substrate-binding protein
MSWKLARRARRLGLLGAVLLVAGCSSMGVGELSSLPDPNDAQFGGGAIKVGLITRDDADDLADGAADSAFLAGQMSADLLANSPVTLLVRRYDGTPQALKAAEDEMLKQGVKLVIGPDDAVASASLASEIGRKGIPVLSLGNASDPRTNLYAFGMSGQVEASLIADEMRRRLYRSIVLVSNPKGTAGLFASQVATAATAVGIAVIPVDGSDPAAATGRIAALAASGRLPSAVVLVESAQAARGLMARVRAAPGLANVIAVGTSAWAFDPEAASAAGPGWYLAPEDNGIADFAERFRKLYNLPPTPDGALAYDLIVMASALPQVFPGKEPYAPEVLLNDQGFKGVTGRFWFTADGQAHRNLLPVEIAPALARPAT